MRAAAHVGPARHDGNGFVGSGLNLLVRMLDARRLKQTLADKDAELALITSSYVYESVILRHPSLADPLATRPTPRGRPHHDWRQTQSAVLVLRSLNPTDGG